MQSATPTPPGWYPDPGGLPTLRWWDGMSWTERHAPPPRPGGSERVASAQSRARIYIILGILIIPAGLAVTSLVPVLGLLFIPAAILCFFRAATVKTCGACRKEVPM
jgi:hypothetical protein